MDSKASLPLRGQQTAKAAYSSPRLEDLGAIGEIALGGVGSVVQMMQMTAAMKHP